MNDDAFFSIIKLVQRDMDMDIKRKDLDDAVKARVIKSEQAEQLWQFWQTKRQHVPTFRFIHILYYLGGLLAISAVTIYVTKAWDRMQGYPLLILAFLLLLLGFSLTHYFLDKKLRIPAGIMASFSLALVPLIVYNIQFLIGIKPRADFFYSDFHRYIDWYWINMELATLLVGFIMLYLYRFPFLLFPISFILWYMSMDLWPLFFGSGQYTFNERATFTMFFGLIVLLAALYLDLAYDDEEDYAFWLYITGVIIFWGGLSCQYSTSELSKFFYLLINVAMLVVSAILNRRVFAVFGAIGILSYVSHLAFTVFANSLGFPVVLVFIGVLIILAAAFFTRIEGKLNELMRPYIPNKILKKMHY